MAAFSGFYESHEPPPSGDARGILPLHRDGHQNGHKEGTFCNVGVLFVAMAAAGAIRSEESPDGSIQWLLM